MVSARVRRQQVEYARKRGLSCRRACALVCVARSALGYQSRLAVKDAPVATRMRELAAQYPRYGYRRVRIFLGREGHSMGPDRAHRLWRQAGLQVPRRRPRRRVAASRPRPLPPTGPNHVWAYDFVFDTSATGQQIKCLTVVGLPPRERSRRASLSQVRQRAGVRLQRDPALDDHRGHRDRPHRPGQALAERHRRELQRPPPRRVPEHGVVSHQTGSGGDHRDLAAALQRRPPALQPRLFDTHRIQSEARDHQQPDGSGVSLASTGPKNPGRSEALARAAPAKA